MEVYVAGSPDRTGFVPFDYVEALASAPPSSSSASSASAGGSAQSASSSSSSSSAAASSSSSLLPEYTLPTATPRALSDTAAGSWARGTTAAAPLNAAEEFSQLFSSHEAWFKAAAAKRQEVYAALKAEAADVLRALRESEAKSATVLARIAELDGLVAAERGRFAGTR